MATYYKDPYKKYYEKLVNAKDMPSSAAKVNNSSESAVSVSIRLQSQLDAAIWEESGYRELATVSVPALKKRMETLRNNVSSGLVVASDKSINTLFPILESIKGKDAELDNINSQIAALKEPVNMYATKINEDGKEISVYSSEYSTYLNKRADLSNKAAKLIEELEVYVAKADAEINSIKALNGNVEKFDSTSASGVIGEIQGLTLTDAEKELLSAMEEGITFDEELTQLANLYPRGKTTLLNDAGGYEYGYSRKIITSHGKVIKVFQQAWNSKSKKYKYQDIENDPKCLSSSGCGYNALASILSSKYPKITPEKLFLDMGRKSLYASMIIEHLGKKYGIKVGNRDDYPSTNPKNKYDETNKKNNLIKEVMKGNMVICTVDARKDTKYTKQGHWVSIVDYDPKHDVFYVTDSNDQDDSNAAPIDATRFLRDYEVNSNVIFIADDSGYRKRAKS